MGKSDSDSDTRVSSNRRCFFAAEPTDDYQLFKLRLRAKLVRKKCYSQARLNELTIKSEISQTEEGLKDWENKNKKIEDEPPTGTTKDAFLEAQERASSVIVESLGPRPLRAVMKHYDFPNRMLQELDSR